MTSPRSTPGASAMACRIATSVLPPSSTTLAVTSTGFSAEPWSGTMALSRALKAASSGGTSRPACSQMSAAQPPAPPEVVTMATRRPRGRAPAPMALATASISSGVCTRSTP
ncbi:MAG: hypothetical protein QM777_23310 [Pseudorhodoferax sp.]